MEEFQSYSNEEVREEFVRAVTTGKHTELAKLIRNSVHLLEATNSIKSNGIEEDFSGKNTTSAYPWPDGNSSILKKDVVKNINYEVKTEIAKAFPQVEIGIDLAETLVHITEARILSKIIR